jgi:hypothetical protein
MTTKKEDWKCLAEKNLVTLDTPIDDLIAIIFAKLGIDVPVTEYAKKLRENLIMDVGHLKRITPHRLGKLNLPILLEEELEKVIGKTKSEFTKPLVGVVVRFALLLTCLQNYLLNFHFSSPQFTKVNEVTFQYFTFQLSVYFCVPFFHKSYSHSLQ